MTEALTDHKKTRLRNTFYVTTSLFYMSKRRSTRISNRTQDGNVIFQIESDDELQPTIEQHAEADAPVQEDLLEGPFKRKNKKPKREKKARNQERRFLCKYCKPCLQDEVTAAINSNPNLPAGDRFIIESLAFSTASELVNTFVDLIQYKVIAALSVGSPVKSQPVTTTKRNLCRFIFPVDPAFFLHGDEPVNPPPPKWQLIPKPFLWDEEKQIPICAVCQFEAVLSSDGLSFLCPGRNRFGTVKEAQKEGCFAVCKSVLMTHVVKFQEQVLTFNTAPPPPLPTFGMCTKRVEERSSFIHKRKTAPDVD